MKRQADNARRNAVPENSRQRRQARRAIEKALSTAEEIQTTAQERRAARLEREANEAARQTAHLDGLYSEFRGDKRDLYATGLIPEGRQYRGRTMGLGR